MYFRTDIDIFFFFGVHDIFCDRNVLFIGMFWDFIAKISWFIMR